MKRSIGGYFELELNKEGQLLYPDLIFLNTGRNALEYILRTRKYKKIFVPFFTCDVILEPIKKLDIEFEFYDVNDQLEPLFDFDNFETTNGFLLNNYFGIKSKYIEKLGFLRDNLIIDNSQALFSAPSKDTDTFYSPRKFVGIPDGGLLSINQELQSEFEEDVSFDRFNHLIKRIDLGAEMAYADFKENEFKLDNQPIKKMSNLTKELFNSINWQKVRGMRIENFNFLHKILTPDNELTFDLKPEDIPMVYPFRHKNAKKLRQILNDNKIYCATYWPNVKVWCQMKENALNLTNEIIPLPIDQRYGLEEMNKIALSLTSELN